jgi:opacity protein-like surface antigen
LLSLGAAAAQTAVQYGNSYLGVAGGVFAPMDRGFKFSGAVPEDTGVTEPHAGNGTIKYDAGPAISLFYGYRLAPWLALEASLDYATYGFHELDINLTGADAEGLTDSGAMKIGGHGTVYVGMASVVVTPWRNGAFSPYLGLGAGAAVKRASIDDPDPGRDDDGVHALAAENSTSPAAGVLLGVDYSPTPALSIGLRYRFLWIKGASVSSSGALERIGGTAKLDDLEAHIVSATLTYHF